MTNPVTSENVFPVVRVVYGKGFAEGTEWPSRAGYSESALISLGEETHFARVLRRIRLGSESSIDFENRPGFLIETGMFGIHCLRVVANTYLDLIEFFRQTQGIFGVFQLQYICEMIGEIGTASMASNASKLTELLPELKKLAEFSGDPESFTKLARTFGSK